jgi:hypothetical protein
MLGFVAIACVLVWRNCRPTHIHQIKPTITDVNPPEIKISVVEPTSVATPNRPESVHPRCLGECQLGFLPPR